MTAEIDPFESLTDVVEFIREFEACRLPKARWTHRAHIVAGLWYITRLEPTSALATIRDRISSHNESVGTANSDSSGYHETITQVYLRGITLHVMSDPARDFMAHLQGLWISPLVDPGWPLKFYSRERLMSVAARRSWVEPDLAPISLE